MMKICWKWNVNLRYLWFAGLLLITTDALSSEEISIYVPPFDGPAGLSQSVNSILRLQIWQTLRKTAPDATMKNDFGDGTVKWGPAKLPSFNYDVAEKMAHHARILSQLVLWGAVQPYGDGAVVLAQLSIPRYARLNALFYKDMRTEHKEDWVIEIPLRGKTVTFENEVPRRRISFEPVVLTKDVISAYSTMDALVLYDVNKPDKAIGTVGNLFTAREQYEDHAVVTSNHNTGIVFLPQLSSHRSEIANFTSGLLRIFRGDWSGAISYFQRVIDNRYAPTDIHIDSYLYMAMASDQLKKSGKDYIAKARSLNPYAVRIARYSIMDKLATLSRAFRAQGANTVKYEIIKTIRDDIQQNADLFLPDDPWLQHVKQGLNEIIQQLAVASVPMGPHITSWAFYTRPTDLQGALHDLHILVAKP